MTHDRPQSAVSISDGWLTFRSMKPGTAGARGVVILAVLFLLLITIHPAQAQTETVLYSFGSQSDDGLTPYAGLIVDKDGNFFGTTSYGGANKEARCSS